MTSRVDFSGNASVYDQRHGAALSPEATHDLLAAAELPPGSRVLEVGAGTGRVAIPLAVAGCIVFALDPAQAMLHELCNKAGGGKPVAVAGVAVPLPFPPACFDAVVFARILYLLPDWQGALAEAVRVLKPGGCLLHEWGNGTAGEEWVAIREKAREMFVAAGLKTPFHPGAHTEEEVEACLAEKGFRKAADLRLESDVRMTLAEFLGRIVDGETTYTWQVSRKIQRKCLPQLREWAARNFNLSRVMPMPRELAWKIYRKH